MRQTAVGPAVSSAQTIQKRVPSTHRHRVAPVRVEAAAWSRWLGSGAIVVVACLAIGGLTSLGQTVLPRSSAPLANSASAWVAAAFIAVVLSRASLLRSAILGTVALIAINCGYAIISSARGFFYGPLEWNLVALVAGPVIGVAAAWLSPTFRGPAARFAPSRAASLRYRPQPLLSRGEVKVAVASGVIAAILVWEASYGLIVNAYPDQRIYWTIQLMIAGALLVFAARGRLERRRALLLQALVAFGGSALFGLAFAAVTAYLFG